MASTEFAMRMAIELRGGLTLAALALVAMFVIVYARFPLPGGLLLDSLRLHLGAVLVVLAIGLAILGGYGRALLFIAIGVAVLIDVFATFGRVQGPGFPEGHSALDLKVVSFNVLFSNIDNATAIAEALAAQNADFVFVQEAAPLASKLDILAAVYPYQVGCRQGMGECDAMLLSRYPLGNTAIRTLGPHSPQRFITATANVGRHSVALGLVHLTKPYFDGAALGELYELEAFVDDVNLPLIVGGDFNSAPWSQGLRQLVRGTPLRFGPASPATWPVELGPLGLPIDHFLASPPLHIAEVSAFEDVLGSNHRGIVARVRLDVSTTP